MRKSCLRLCLLALAGALFVSPLRAESSEGDRLYVRAIAPILSSKCAPCHGDDPEKLRGDYDMRTRKSLIAGGESGKAAVVPGDPNSSPLYRAVTWEDPDLEMPPKANDRLSAKQIADVRTWIELGASWPSEAVRKRLEAELAESLGVEVQTSGGQGSDWTQRRYAPEDLWSRRPFEQVRPQLERALAQNGSFIDVFIDSKLKEIGVEPAPVAERRDLERRVTFSLTGLPPSHESSKAQENSEPFAELVERLLASPHYGERMAQHWLDVTRYADTAGFANDFERPHAWRYRDYVIRSFNEDKPFDRFILEQIAGDEVDPDSSEARVALGFLRMGPWEQTAMSVAAVTRQLWLDDVTNSVGETFLGHSLRCASCHDHKFDPIPTRDYYSMQAVFAATRFDEPRAELHASEKHENAKERTQRVRAQLSTDRLTPLVKLESDNAFGSISLKMRKYRERAEKRFDATAFSVKNGKPQPVHILTGGSLARPTDVVSPGVLSAYAGAGANVIPSSARGRRKALATWIASTRNPLTARVIVNRVWQWHFGRGLVATPNSFGKMGAKPSHPLLLDALALRFVDEGWSIKKLHRWILTSRVYQRSSSHPNAELLERKDPGNALLARFSPRRLSAEEMRDAMLLVSGELSRDMGGPGIFPEINWEVALQPRHIMGGVAPSYRPSLEPAERHRRTIYVFRYRGLSDPLLEVFNKPNPDLSCERRDSTTVSPQAFELMNGRFANDRALALAADISKSVRTPEDKISAAFLRVYGRLPERVEIDASLRHMNRQLEHHKKTKPERVDLPSSVERRMITEQSGVLFRWREDLHLEGFVPDLQAWQVDPTTRAFADLCLVLLNSSGFFYVY